MAALIAGTAPAMAAKRTVCTMTVNSADEKDAFRRYLPASEFEFVELVQPGQRDWLAAACRKDIHCDVLVVSGHFNGQDFFSDRLDVAEFLPVEELERAACSESCPGVFENLQEVYLFGCTTLSPEPIRSMSGDVVRSLVREGKARGDAERKASVLNERYGRTNRDVMRRVFADVPVIYGFSSVAPLGATAGPLLGRYFQGSRGSEVGRGRPSRKLLSQFSAHSLVAVRGLSDDDADADYRSESCALLDERISPIEKLQFVRELLDRDTGQVRLFFDDIERFLAKLPADAANAPAFTQTLGAIAADRPARERYLAYARDADAPALRARMVAVARKLDWLSAQEERAEHVDLVAKLLGGRPVPTADIGLACALGAGGDLAGELPRLRATGAATDRADHAAVLACLGDPDGHERTLQALTSLRKDDQAAAEMYLQHRPLRDPVELRQCGGCHRRDAAVGRPGARPRRARTPPAERPRPARGPAAALRRDPLAQRAALDRGHPDPQRIPRSRVLGHGARPARPAVAVAGRRGHDRHPHPPDGAALVADQGRGAGRSTRIIDAIATGSG